MEQPLKKLVGGYDLFFMAVHCIPHSGQQEVGGSAGGFKEVLRKLGTARTPSVNLKLKNNSQFAPALVVPIAIKDAVGQEIQRSSVGKKVRFSRWATPVVPVPKRVGSFRICRDLKANLNPALETDQNPIL